MDDWFFPEINRNVDEAYDDDDDDDVEIVDEGIVNFEPMEIFGEGAQEANVDEEEMETGLDEQRHQETHRHVIDVRKIRKGSRAPLSLDPLLFVGEEDPPPTTTPDVFAKRFGAALAPGLVDSLISTTLAERAKNSERGGGGGGGEWTDEGRELQEDRYTRQLDDEYLRTPFAWERPCANGDHCEGKHWFGDVLVERPSNRDLKEAKKTGKPYRGHPETCVRCKRAEAMKHYLAYRFHCGNMTEVAPPFFNTPDVPGEYVMEQMIVGGGTPMHQPLYIAMELGLCYERVAQGNCVRHKQTGYLDPADQDGRRPFVLGSGDA